MQTFVIYFNRPGKLDSPLDDPFYFASYKGFADYCKTRGTQVYAARGDSYQGNMRFRNCYEFVDNDLVDVPGIVTADAVYNKGVDYPFTFEPDALVINSPAFDELTESKWHMAETFGDLMPATYEISSENWREVVAKISTDKIVLKPVDGLGGYGIIITEKATLDFPSLNLTTPYIAQPFVDSSNGIPGICDSYHDLRILIFNGEPKLSYIRTPKPGSLLSNISQGASAFAVDIAKVPAEILDMARQVDAAYASYYPRHYSADFFMGPDRPYLVETNTQPGFPRSDSEGVAFQQQYYQYLFELMNEAVTKRHGK